MLNPQLTNLFTRHAKIRCQRTQRFQPFPIHAFNAIPVCAAKLAPRQEILLSRLQLRLTFRRQLLADFEKPVGHLLVQRFQAVIPANRQFVRLLGKTAVECLAPCGHTQGPHSQKNPKQITLHSKLPVNFQGYDSFSPSATPQIRRAPGTKK